MMEIFLMVIFAEAVINLIFKGTVLQPLRDAIITYTNFLRVRGEHPLECKLCISVWVGLLSSLIYLFLGIVWVKWFIIGIVIHRLSNCFHLVISLIADIQMDKRVERRKNLQ